jgi:hypothetical protein
MWTCFVKEVTNGSSMHYFQDSKMTVWFVMSLFFVLLAIDMSEIEDVLLPESWKDKYLDQLIVMCYGG